jgi:uncharacterized protein (DUF1778 family)
VSVPNRDARLNFRLPPEVKQTIEEAAAHLGQSASEFAVSTLVDRAQSVIQQHNVTRLSNGDRDIFLAMPNDEDAEPNEALKAAAEQYRDEIG